MAGGRTSVTRREESYGCPFGWDINEAHAFFSLWNFIKRLKSMSKITSPHRRRKSSSRTVSHSAEGESILKSAPAVPSGVVSLKYFIETPNFEPSPKYFFITSPKCPITRVMSVSPHDLRFSI